MSSSQAGPDWRWRDDTTDCIKINNKKGLERFLERQDQVVCSCNLFYGLDSRYHKLKVNGFVLFCAVITDKCCEEAEAELVIYEWSLCNGGLWHPWDVIANESRVISTLFSVI